MAGGALRVTALLLALGGCSLAHQPRCLHDCEGTAAAVIVPGGRQ